jgi:predicted metal-dependent peptidase
MATAIANPIAISEADLFDHEIRRIQTLRAQVVVHHPFWATLLLPMQVELSPWIPTFAATDCVSRMWINPFWTYHLSLKQLGYILIHEVGHLVFLTAARRLTRDHHRWNDATDYAINAIIEELTDKDGRKLYERPDLEIPDLGLVLRPLYDEAFKNLVAEEIYDTLKTEEPETCPRCGQKHRRPQNGSGGTGKANAPLTRQNGKENPNGASGAGNKPHPQNGTAQNTPQAGSPQPQNGNRNNGKDGRKSQDSQQGDLFGPGQCPRQGEDQDQNPQDGGSHTGDGQNSSDGQGDGKGHPGCPNQQTGSDGVLDFNGHCRPGQTDVHLPPDLTERQVQDVIDQIINAHQIWNASNQRGSMPAGLSRFIQKLREARVPWQRVVHQYAGTALAKDDFSLNPPHRRWLQYDIIRPSLRSETIALLAIAMDSSGSTQPVLEEFAAEMAKLHTLAEETLILTCDAQIHQVVKTREVPEFLRRLKIQGGGGTSHLPVFEWFKKNRMFPDLLVALTDLQSEFPPQRPPFPVLWCVTEDHGPGPGWGKIVVIPHEPARTSQNT